MLFQRYKQYTWVLIFTLLFFCKGASLGMLMQPEDHPRMNGLWQSDHVHTAAGEDVPCCSGTQESQVHMDHTLPLLFTSVMAVVILLLVVFWGYTKHTTVSVQKIYFYLVSVKDRYGGFRLWDQYRYLFQQGILHPRVW